MRNLSLAAMALPAALAIAAAQAQERDHEPGQPPGGRAVPPAGEVTPYAASDALKALMLPYRMEAHRFVAPDGGKLPFLLSRPDVAADAAGPYPLLLFLHGLGEAGTDLKKVFRHVGAFDLAKADWQRHTPCYILAPQQPEGAHWWSPHFTELEPLGERTMALLRRVIADARPAVDTNRVYVTGLCSGGWGANDLARKSPGFFAACVPVGSSVLKGAVLKGGVDCAKFPHYWFLFNGPPLVGEQELDRQFAERLRAAGRQCRIDYFERMGTDVWTWAFHEPLMWRWLFAQRLGEKGAAATVAGTDAFRAAVSASANRPARRGCGPERAVDGMMATQYVSARDASPGDDLTVRFADTPCAGPFVVVTGTREGKSTLQSGRVEVSCDGERFETLTEASGARIAFEPPQPIRALRLIVGKGHRGPLFVREILLGDEIAAAACY